MNLKNRIFTLVGIINQLATTGANRELRSLGLSVTQLSILDHFAQRKDQGRTVTFLANAFEVNQPTMTKRVQALVKKGFLEEQNQLEDRRVKKLFITHAGLHASKIAWETVRPIVEGSFDDWKIEDIEQLQQLLDQLKIRLDTARD